MVNPMETSEIRTKYEELQPRYTRLVEEVKTALRSALDGARIETSAIFGRVKTMDSVLGKVDKKGYKDPFSQNDDFAGVRFVCRYTPELDRVETIIKKEFAVLQTEDKSASLDVDRMGFQGRHYVVALMPHWRGYRYDNLVGLRCEIQLRTICQDAWAQISRHLEYGSTESIPAPIHRELNRMAGLLETAQISFDGLNAKRDEYAQQVDASQHTVDAFLLQPIDRETVRAYALWKYPNLGIKNNILELFIRDLDQSRYKTLQDIDEAVNAAKPFCDSYQREKSERFASGVDYLTKSLGFFDPQFGAKHPFGHDTKKAFDASAAPAAIKPCVFFSVQHRRMCDPPPPQPRSDHLGGTVEIVAIEKWTDLYELCEKFAIGNWIFLGARSKPPAATCNRA